MVKENNKEEKLCLFFASDYHFEMISLPYISENLKKDKKVIVITENDLNNTIEKLLSNINLTEEEKEKIAKIDWKNNDEDKFEQIKKANEENKNTIIFVKGKENYIDSINKNIKNLISSDKINIVDCYDINEVQNDVKNITKQYGKILSTSGVEKLL